MSFIFKKIIVFPLLFGLIGCNSGASSETSGIKGAEINIKTAVKEVIEGFGEVYYLNVRNSQSILKFGEYIEVNEDANWSISRDIEGKETIPTRTVELLEGHSIRNLYYVYVSNDVAKEYETYPILIHRNYMFTVTFDSCGGSYCQPQEVEEGFLLEESKIPTPYLKGYTFSGWNYDFSKPITRQITVYASWDVKHYTLNLNPNGGTITPSSVDVYYGQSVSDGLPVPERNGYEFIGWEYDGHMIESGDCYYFDEDITIKAIWSPVHYSITYHLDGGINAEENPNTYTIEDEFDFQNPSKEKYLFSGWKNEKGNYITGIKLGQTGNIDVYAEWDENYGLCFEYQLSSDESYYTLRKYQNLFDGRVRIPQIYNNKPIKLIGNDCFANSVVTTPIYIPNGIETLQSRCFSKMKNPLEIYLTDSIIKINEQAFQNTEVSNAIIDLVTTIGDKQYGPRYISNSDAIYADEVLYPYYALVDFTYDPDFYNSAIQDSYTIKDGCILIADAGLANQEYLKTITIPNSVKYIGVDAFYNCPLDSINFLGTMSEWNNVSKGRNWHMGSHTTVVHCTNGDIGIDS